MLTHWEERVELLEKELEQTRKLLFDTLHVLEDHLGQDIDKDGITGKPNKIMPFPTQ